MSGADHAYYSENDEFAALWLRNLIGAGLIAPGEVDTRSIVDVRPDDLRGFAQCHFFAGIGLWSHALRLAGWSDERAVWTGSCPCQPHSGAANVLKRGFADPRDLWPVWLALIRERCSVPVFGEQVDDSVAWIDRMHIDLEHAGFAIGAVDLPACAEDAAHERMRTFFVAYPNSAGRGEQGRPLAMDPELVRIERAGGCPCIGNDVTTGELGRRRRTPHGVRLLADVYPGRVGRLRAYGNAIVPSIAAQFIKAAIEVIP